MEMNIKQLAMDLIIKTISQTMSTADTFHWIFTDRWYLMPSDVLFRWSATANVNSMQNYYVSGCNNT